MIALLGSQNLLEIVAKGYNKPRNEATLFKVQRGILMGARKLE